MGVVNFLDPSSTVDTSGIQISCYPTTFVDFTPRRTWSSLGSPFFTPSDPIRRTLERTEKCLDLK